MIDLFLVEQPSFDSEIERIISRDGLVYCLFLQKASGRSEDKGVV